MLRRVRFELLAASSWIALIGRAPSGAEGLPGLGEGKVTLNVRERFETCEQGDAAAAPISNKAQASTIRLALGYRTPRRQFHQSFDAFSLEIRPVREFTGRLVYAARVHRVFGPEATDGSLAMRAPMFHFAYQRAGTGQL